jgi:hypothetical protein
MAFANRRLRKPRLFLCYRRKDSKHVEALRNALAAEFGPKRVFMDQESIRPGTNFPTAIQTALSSADVLLAVIGPKWTVVDKRGRTRLDDPQDYVRLELETALRREIPVFPVLLNDAKMPAGKALPESLRPLVEQQAIKLTTVDWEPTVRGKLIPAVHDGAREYWKNPPPPAERLPATGRRRAAFTAWLQWQFPTVSRVLRQMGEHVGSVARWVAPRLARWPTSVLRVGAAIWVLVLVASWLAVALWQGPGLGRLPGDSVTYTVGSVIAGLFVAPLSMLAGGFFGLTTWGMLAAVEVFSARWAGRPREDLRGIAVGVTLAFIGVFTLLCLGIAVASLGEMIEHQRMPTAAEMRPGPGYAAVAAWLLASVIGLVCSAGLRPRAVRGSRRVADQYFPLLVGVVALAAFAVGPWIGVVAAALLVALCVACLFVEVWDRASSLGAYLGGVAMTTTAGGALALL